MVNAIDVAINPAGLPMTFVKVTMVAKTTANPARPLINLPVFIEPSCLTDLARTIIAPC